MIRLALALLVLLAASDRTVPSDANDARIFVDPRASVLIIDLAPVDLPARTPHHAIAQPPVATLEIPETGSIYGFRVEVVDSTGAKLPDDLHAEAVDRSEEHTSELQSRRDLVCRLLLEKKKIKSRRPS